MLFADALIQVIYACDGGTGKMKLSYGSVGWNYYLFEMLVMSANWSVASIFLLTSIKLSTVLEI